MPHVKAAARRHKAGWVKPAGIEHVHVFFNSDRAAAVSDSRWKAKSGYAVTLYLLPSGNFMVSTHNGLPWTTIDYAQARAHVVPREWEADPAICLPEPAGELGWTAGRPVKPCCAAAPEDFEQELDSEE